MKIKQNKGFSLLEVLIAFVILIVGLLGATTLIIRSSQVNVKAYETEQMAMIASSMVERIRANPAGIGTYKDKAKSENQGVCVGASTSCSASERAQRDNYWFNEQIKVLISDVSDINADWDLSLLSDTGTLTGASGNVYKLKITWGAESTNNSTSTNTNNVYVINFVL